MENALHAGKMMHFSYFYAFYLVGLFYDFRQHKIMDNTYATESFYYIWHQIFQTIG